MKTNHFRPYKCMVCAILLLCCCSVYGNPTLLLFRNGEKVIPTDMSIGKNDVITVQVSDNDTTVKYKISALKFEIRTQQYQQVKEAAQAAKYHKVEMKKTEQFMSNPKIDISIKNYASKYVSRILVTLLKVEKLKKGKTSDEDSMTYGKEYIFWYNDN